MLKINRTFLSMPKPSNEKKQTELPSKVIHKSWSDVTILKTMSILKFNKRHIFKACKTICFVDIKISVWYVFPNPRIDLKHKLFDKLCLKMMHLFGVLQNTYSFLIATLSKPWPKNPSHENIYSLYKYILCLNEYIGCY